MVPHHRVGGDIHISQPLPMCGCAGGFVGFSPTPLLPCGGAMCGSCGGGGGFAATQPWPIMMHGGGARGGGPPQFFAGVGPQSMQQQQQIHYSAGPPNQYQ